MNLLDYNIYDYDTYPDDNTSQYSSQEDEEPENIYQFSPSPVLPYDDKYYRTFFKAPLQDHSNSLVLPPVQEVIYNSDERDLTEGLRDKKSLIIPTDSRYTPQMVNFGQLFVPSRRIQVLILCFLRNSLSNLGI